MVVLVAMCQWRLAHSGVGGGLVGYVPVVAGTSRGGWGAGLVMGLRDWLFSAVVVVWEYPLCGNV